MRSKAESFGKVIDCRSIIFQAEYYCLSEEKLLQLATLLYSFVNDLFSDKCVISWHIRNKSIRNETVIKQTNIQTNEIFTIDAIGDVKCDRVINKTGLRKYEKDLGNNMIFYLPIVPPFASVDYPEYASQRLVPYEKDPHAFRQAVIDVFSEEGRVNLSQSQTHDITVMLLCKKDGDNHNLICGNFFIGVSLFCLNDDELEKLSKQLLELLRQIAEEYINVNASIRIAQTWQEFDYYWRGENLCQDDTTYDLRDGELRSLINQRIKYLYLTSIGWANALSPVVMDYYNKHQNSHTAANVLREKTAGGGTIYLSEKKITDFQLMDAKEIKKELYPCIVPSYIEAPVHYNGIGGIRSNWENVPILDEEIKIKNGKIVIQHQVPMDLEYILGWTGEKY